MGMQRVSVRVFVAATYSKISLSCRRRRVSYRFYQAAC